MKKYLFSALAAASAASALTVECLPTHNVFYAGVEKQACLRVKVTGEAGESLNTIQFYTGKTSNPADIAQVRLYSSKLPVFSPNAPSGGDFVAQELGTTSAVGLMTFSKEGGLISFGKDGTQYLWLVYDISSTAKGNNKITAECISVTDGKGSSEATPLTMNGTVQADGVSPALPAEVYPYKYRVYPYYRFGWFSKGWGSVKIDATHFKYLTDFIIFGFTNNGTQVGGKTTGQAGVAFSEVPKVKSGVEKLRGKNDVRIIAGFDEGDQGGEGSFGSVMADAEKRNEFAVNVAGYLKENKYDGVDFDWEYPRQGQGSWYYYALFMAKLREELAGTGITISLACNPNWDMPTTPVTDQVDILNLMTYGRQYEHSTMEHVAFDMGKADANNVPRVKQVLGLPFYSKDTNQHHQGADLGYSDIVAKYPTIAPSVNTCKHPTNGSEQYFNGVNLIKQKCKHVTTNKMGGVMVWAYECDMPLSNARSLSKAMFSVIKRTKR